MFKFKEEYENYLKLERELCYATVSPYLKKVEEFYAFLSNKEAEEITETDIQSFLMDAKNNKGIEITHHILALRSYFKWLAYKTKEDHIRALAFYLTNIVKAKKAHKKLINLPSPADVMKLRDTLKAYKAAYGANFYSLQYKRLIQAIAVFELLLSTGIRSGELRNLRACDIDLKNRVLFVRQSKTGEQRRSIFSELAKLALEDYFGVMEFKPEDIIFPMKQGNVLNYVLKRWLVRAGLDGSLHAHSFRHYFITETQRQGVSVTMVARQVGHKSLNTTLHYTHTDVETIRDALEKCEL
jgi:integrase/recombinase XerD